MCSLLPFKICAASGREGLTYLQQSRRKSFNESVQSSYSLCFVSIDSLESLLDDSEQHKL